MMIPIAKLTPPPQLLPAQDANDTRVGVALVAASLLSVVLMAHHPSFAAQGITATLAEIAQKAPLSQGVHGGLIALMAVQAGAFGELSTRLGWQNRTVRVAALAYGSGLLSMIGAALISGFVISRLGVRFEATDARTEDALRCVLAACTVGNRVLASFATVAVSVAIGLWSWALRKRGNAGRVLSALGLLLGVVSAAVIVTGALPLEVRGMQLVVLAQTVWNVAVGLSMARGRLGA